MDISQCLDSDTQAFLVTAERLKCEIINAEANKTNLRIKCNINTNQLTTTISTNMCRTIIFFFKQFHGFF